MITCMAITEREGVGMRTEEERIVGMVVECLRWKAVGYSWRPSLIVLL